MRAKRVASTDEDLMRSVAAGDEQAFCALVERHQGRILNLLSRFLGDRYEAEDLTQEVFVRVWKSARTYKPKAKFTTWLYRIAVNLSINRQRYLQIRRRLTISKSDPHTQASGDPFTSDQNARPETPETKLMRSELSQQVKAAIDALPTDQRLAIILRIYDELSYQDISSVLGRSVSAVDSLLIRAKKNLRKKLPLKK
jgi:RNA polymerase sigma-70 factor, ECF subfamily